MGERCFGRLLFGSPNYAPFQRAGARARAEVLDRRNGLARGIYDRLIADDRFPGRQIPSEVQWRLDAAI